MHDLHTRNRTTRRPKGLEAQHGTREPFHGSMVLLHEVIEILGVPDDNGCLVSLIVVLDSRCVAATLIDGDLLWQSLTANSFV